MKKKTQQLGMNPATASGRLVKDLLFKFVTEAGHRCFRCGEALTRDTFSIEHKESWLDSGDPVGRFFDLENIAFSHKVCNYGAARQGVAPANKTYASVRDRDLAKQARKVSRRRSLVASGVKIPRGRYK